MRLTQTLVTGYCRHDCAGNLRDVRMRKGGGGRREDLSAESRHGVTKRQQPQETTFGLIKPCKRATTSSVVAQFENCSDILSLQRVHLRRQKLMSHFLAGNTDLQIGLQLFFCWCLFLLLSLQNLELFPERQRQFCNDRCFVAAKTVVVKPQS